MTEEEEKKRWQQMVVDLHQLFTLEHIANEMEVTVRAVSNWKAGTDRPLGMNAVRLYLFHDKHRTVVQVEGTPVHSISTGRAVTS